MNRPRKNYATKVIILTEDTAINIDITINEMNEITLINSKKHSLKLGEIFTLSYLKQTVINLLSISICI